MILVGNKIDRKNERYELKFLEINLFKFQIFRVVSTEEGRELAREWNVHFIEVSAMDLEVKFYFLKICFF
jgi:GTPase SAR1 family protein